MPNAARLNDTVDGMTAGEHCGHSPPHPPLPFTGYIIDNVSQDVFINHRGAAYIGSITIEYDACCGHSFGIVAEGSATVFVNHIPASRIWDALDPHNGEGIVTSGSEDVFIGD